MNDMPNNDDRFIVHHVQRRSLTSITIIPSTIVVDLPTFLTIRWQRLERFIIENINLDLPYKISVLVEAQFSIANNNDDINDEQRVRTFVFSTAYQPLITLRDNLFDACNRLERKLQTYQDNSSGFRLDGIVNNELLFIRYNPLTHVAARSYIPTPSELYSKKCTINLHNNDNHCFLYSILAALYYESVKNNKRMDLNQYNRHLDELIYDNDDMPMKVGNITKFEHQNNRFAINVFGWRNAATRTAKGFGDKVTAISNPFVDVLHISQNTRPTAIPINLCVITSDDEMNFHYIWIRNMDRFLNCRADHGRAEINIQKKWCKRCVRAFDTQKSLDHHQDLCLHFLKFGGSMYELSPYKTLEFREWHKTVAPSYVVFADFESVLQPSDDALSARCSILQKHLPNMAAYLMVPIAHGNEQLLEKEYKVFEGSSCIHDFLVAIEDLAARIGEWYCNCATVPMIPLTDSQQTSYENATTCYLCQHHLATNDKVRDHDHVSGQYMGAAHRKCNLSRKQTKILPIFFHNLRKYDMHHIIRFAQESMTSWELDPIAQTSETFLALKVRFADKTTSPVRFLDSCQFLQSSLDNLAKMMSPADFTLCRDLPQWNGMLHKQIFPYSFVTDYQVLDQQMDSLPPYNTFFDVLRNEMPVTEEEYENANTLYRQWNCHSLGDYLKIYLKVDVYLLADCFQYFRKMMLEDEGLEPSHFFSIPGMSWSSALKRTGCKLETLQDSVMYETFEAAIRGGLTFVNTHFAEHSEGKQELLYLDVNNLYGWALSEALPFSDFKWIFDEDILNNVIQSLPSMDCANCEIGYLLDVDIVIPQNLHDFMCDLPVAPEHMIPPPQRFNNNASKTRKLITSLLPKQHYLVHFRLLQLYMDLGAQVVKVHRAISFRQSRIFKSFIDYNTERRKSNSNTFNKNLYKLKNNSLYGKTCENVRKRINLKICNTPEKLVKYSSKVTFRKTTIITEDLVLALLRKGRIILDKPIYIGQAVLDLSKFIMYDLYYHKLKRYEAQFGCTIEIMGGDTDSFFLACRNVSLRHQLLPRMTSDGLLDTSNYDKNDPLYSDSIACKIGCVKDESGGKVFSQFCLLQPKMYSMAYLSDSSSAYKKAKGVQRNVVEKQLKHQDYVDMFNSIGTIYEDEACESDVAPPLVKRQRRFASLRHQLYTVEQVKVALNCRDNKRMWISHNKSVPFGHYSL